MADSISSSTKVCRHFNECSGCSLWTMDYQKQLAFKRNALENDLAKENILLSNQIKMCGFSSLHFRDRTDISLVDGKLGFYRNDQSRRIVDIEKCELFSPSLQNWFTLFKSIVHRHSNFLKDFKISFRLRVSPLGEFGVWIDTSHVNTKNIFEQKVFLFDLLEVSIVEVGQKLKRLQILDGELKLLKEPVLHYWMNSFNETGDVLKLYSSIGSFTQPGNLTNEILMNECITLIKNAQLHHHTCLELFSGMGNFTLMLLSLGLKVTSIEVSKTAFHALEKALENHEQFQSLIQFKELSLYKKSSQRLFNGEELLVVDPPRSGLGFVIDELAKIENDFRPKHIIYISCLASSMIEDLTRLRGLGYGIETIIGVDQFAYSEHCEWISYLSLRD